MLDLNVLVEPLAVLNDTSSPLLRSLVTLSVILSSSSLVDIENLTMIEFEPQRTSEVVILLSPMFSFTASAFLTSRLNSSSLPLTSLQLSGNTISNSYAFSSGSGWLAVVVTGAFVGVVELVKAAALFSTVEVASDVTVLTSVDNLDTELPPEETDGEDWPLDGVVEVLLVYVVGGVVVPPPCDELCLDGISVVVVNFSGIVVGVDLELPLAAGIDVFIVFGSPTVTGACVVVEFSSLTVACDDDEYKS